MQHLLFVTGKLAEPSLRRLLGELAPRAGFEFSVAVLPITVVSLATTSWIARHLTVPTGMQRILLPGLCAGDPAAVAEKPGLAVDRGPDDLRALPEFLGEEKAPPSYGAYDIAILAEINHAPRLPVAELLAQARAAHASGADVVDIGCDPGATWEGIGPAV